MESNNQFWNYDLEFSRTGWPIKKFNTKSNKQNKQKWQDIVLIGPKRCENSDFVVSELVVGSGEQDYDFISLVCVWFLDKYLQK